MVLCNLSCRTLKIKRGIKIAHVEASNVVPFFGSSQVYENVPKKAVGNSPKSDLLKNLPEENGGRL